MSRRGTGTFTRAAAALNHALLGALTPREGVRAVIEHLEGRQLLAAGSLDPTFGIGGKVFTHIGDAEAQFDSSYDFAKDVAIQPDGKIIVVGDTMDAGRNTYGGTTDSFVRIARYLPSGQLDSTFDGDGKMAFEFFATGTTLGVTSVALDTDGDILVVGRWTPSDPPNAHSVLYTAVAKLSKTNGQPVRASTTGIFEVTRTVNGVPTVFDFEALPGGDVVVVPDSLRSTLGYAFAVPATRGADDSGGYDHDSHNVAYLKFNASGVQVGKVHGSATDVVTADGALSRDGVMTLAGADGDYLRLYYDNGSAITAYSDPQALTNVGDTSYIAMDIDYGTGEEPDRAVLAWLSGTSPATYTIARYNMDTHELDDSFSGDGLVTISDTDPAVHQIDVAVDDDGRVIVATVANNSVTTHYDFAIYRFTEAGVADSDFKSGSTNGVVHTSFGSNTDAAAYALALDNQDRIVAAGFFDDLGTPSPDTEFDFALARYDNSNNGTDNDHETVTGTSGADHYYVKRSGNNINIWYADVAVGSPDLVFAASIDSLTFDTLAGDDTLTVDNSGGDPVPAGGIIYLAGAGTDDIFRAIGSSSTNTAAVTPATLTFAGEQAITFVNAEHMKLSTGEYSTAFDLRDAVSAALKVTVQNAATLNFGVGQHLNGLTIDSGGLATVAAVATAPAGNKMLVTTSLSIGSTGKIDMRDQDMIIDYTGSTPYSTINSLLVAARNGDAWNGNGIWSSSAAALTTYHQTTLGMMEGSAYRALDGSPTTFNGEAVDTTSLVIKYTWLGDTDFNGVVQLTDYDRAGYGYNTSLSGWSNGDMDGNGVVNFDDFALIDPGYIRQTGTL